MSAVIWTKLTLNELKDLCLSCGLDLVGNQYIGGENDPAEEEAHENEEEPYETTGAEVKSSGRKSNIKKGKQASKKLDAVLVEETEQKSLLNKAWAQVKLKASCNQHEYDFLIGVRKRFDKAIARLPEDNQRDFVAVREKFELRAVTLRLANERMESSCKWLEEMTK
ncbi:hypothetical protein C2G38_2218134 [Gigaspora rosea]|uniref:Uncharacterized protein n=1 Tax=Gigaspora rosea TaxID=44941 RepID=A0A397U707_9GLOM|nr:hypothetical protein C2G38_2218134 [Gigaspora rosea]